MHESFTNIARYRYALYATVVGFVCLLSYIIDAGFEAPNGGTVLGYTLGTIAAAQVLYLMCYGIRRRSFKSRAGSTKRWLSIHFYMGLCVLLVASLHCGFQFGANVHTLAFALLFLVVISGSWGVYAYLRYPALMARERGEESREELLARVAELDRLALSIGASAAPPVRDLIADAIHRARLGGGWWAQLCGRDASTLLLAPTGYEGHATLVRNPGQRALIAQLAWHQSTSQCAAAQLTVHKLLEISGEKAVALRRLQRDVQLQGLLQFWLYLHLPLSFGLLAALAVHVFSVFYYR
jgi:multisubunit Na+/H+ antiporter MnhB subunit